MKSSFPLDHTPRLFRKQYRDEVGGYLSSSCCAVNSAPFLAFFAMEDFVEDNWNRGGNKPDNQYQLLSLYIRHNALFSVA